MSSTAIILMAVLVINNYKYLSLFVVMTKNERDSHCLWKRNSPLMICRLISLSIYQLIVHLTNALISVVALQGKSVTVFPKKCALALTQLKKIALKNSFE